MNSLQHEVELSAQILTEEYDKIARWLIENLTGDFKSAILNNDTNLLVFRFEKPEDAAYFKLCWAGA